MIKQIIKKKQRIKKHNKIRSKIIGTNKIPRICVFKSIKYIEAQIIDDIKGNTLVHASSLEFKKDGEVLNNIETSKKVGELLANKAIKNGIKKVVFDRSGYIYHGKIKSLADGARIGGLEF